MRYAFSARDAFTLIELIVSVVCVAALAALIGISIHKVQKKSQAAVCASHLRQLGFYIFQYASDYNGDLLPTVQRNYPGSSGSGDPWSSILNNNSMLPFSSWEQKRGSIMHCPSRTTRNPYFANSLPSRQYNAHHYAMNSFPGVGNLIMLGEPKNKLAAIPNPSGAVLMGEADWFYVIFPKYSDNRISPHDGGSNLLYCDGHVEYYPDDLPIYRLPDNSGTGQMFLHPGQTMPPFIK